MKTAFKRVGMTLASMSILVSMFSGVVIAQPEIKELQNERLYAQVALAMQLSEDPVGTFYTFTPTEQEQVREAMRFHYANMQAIVENGGTDEDFDTGLQAYIVTIPDSLAYIIGIDFTYTWHESSEGYNYDSECVLNHQDHDDDDEDGNYTKRALVETQDDSVYALNALATRLKPADATCPDDYPCWMSRWYEHTCYGSVNGQKHWTMYAAITAQHNANHIDWTVGWQTTYKWTYNGWYAKSGTWTQTLSKSYVDFTYYSLLFGATNLTNCEFSNGWFTIELSQIAVTISMDASGECYITWVDATISVNWLPGITFILSTIALGISIASGNIPGIIISGYFFIDSLIKLN
ncbi:MAG: hypothetical protein FWF37_00140 [Chloroflexi bacterium]|nr:hypothetical protein [Chloroflexota bacterium]